MKRALYFLIERLSITPGERRVMSILIPTFILLTIAQWAVPQKESFPPEYYEAVLEEFQFLSQELRQEEQAILARYSVDANHNNAATHSFDVHVNVASDDTLQAPRAEKTDSLLNINTATASEFERLPGVGPSIASNIVRYRNENGPFDRIEALLNVRGIGEARLEQIRPYITL